MINQFQVNGVLKIGYDWVEMREPAALQALAGLTHSVLRGVQPLAVPCNVNA